MSQTPDIGSVLHVASGDLWGGAEAVVFALVAAQNAARPGSVNCVLLNDGRLAVELRSAGIPVSIVDESKAGFASLLVRLARIIAHLRPALVHAHRDKENLLCALAARLARTGRRRPRLVSTVHGMPEPPAGANVLKRMIVLKTNSCTLALGFDAVVGVSDDIVGLLRRDGGFRNVVSIHNGVRTSTDTPTRRTSRTPQADSLHIIALGRLVPIKRFERLGQLSDLLSEYLSGQEVVVSLAGDGPLAAQLRSGFERTGRAPAVNLLGFVPQPAALLDAADALVMTSDHEGLPMSVLEALAMGLPVFAFAVGGLPEIQEDGIPLFLVPAGDVEALAREMAAYFKRPQTVRTKPPQDWRFDIRNSATVYDRLYCSLLAS